MHFVCSSLAFVGRIFICIIFIAAAVNKLTHWDLNAQMMAAKGMTNIPLLLILGMIVEFIGGLSLLLGFKPRLGALLLFLFLIPTTLIMHNFWSVPEVERDLQTVMFFKNLAIMGGLLYIMAFGPGSCAIDGCCDKRGDIDNPKSC